MSEQITTFIMHISSSLFLSQANGNERENIQFLIDVHFLAGRISGQIGIFQPKSEVSFSYCHLS